MTHEQFTTSPETVFADTEKRTISGIAIPAGETAVKGGRVWRFLPGSVTFAARTPLLIGHEDKAVGRLTASEWTDEGLRTTFVISRTTAGDEALQLAADGVLGLSVGVNVPAGGATTRDGEFQVSKAHATETSLTALPAFAGASIDRVQLHQGRTAKMPDIENDGQATEAVINVTIPEGDPAELGRTIADAVVAKLSAGRPVPQAVPATTQVREQPAYRFDGNPGKFNFVRDSFAAYVQHDPAARQRVETFLTETFVTQANVAALHPTGYRPDLYVDERQPRRPLGSLISGGALTEITPFVVPKFSSAGTLVAPHVEGVEPSLATFVATSQTIEPHALSGKAEITRETVDKAGPAVDQMIWRKMLDADDAAAEARIAEMLGDFTDASPLALVGTGATLADDLETTLLGVADMDRYGVLAAEPALFSALATARDSASRKLFTAINPVNADGRSTGRWTLDLGNGLSAVQVPSLDESYLIERGAVYQWLSAPRKMEFDIQVKSVFLGFWRYSAEAIIDNSGIRRVTYAAS